MTAREPVVTDAPRFGPTAIEPDPGGGILGHAADFWGALPGPADAAAHALAAARAAVEAASHGLPPALDGGASDASIAGAPPLLAVSAMALGACLARALAEGGANGSYPALSARPPGRGPKRFRPTEPKDDPTEGGTRASNAQPRAPRARPD